MPPPSQQRRPNPSATAKTARLIYQVRAVSASKEGARLHPLPTFCQHEIPARSVRVIPFSRFRRRWVTETTLAINPLSVTIWSGTQQVLIEDGQGTHWVDANVGDYVRISGSALHAHRNVSDEPAVDLIVTTARMGQLFREISRPFTGTPLPVTPEALAHFMEVSTRYGVRLGTPAENAAVGIDLPVFAG
jgi:hypothetical protein